MDNEKLKQFFLPILVIIITIVLFCMLITKVANNVQNIIALKNNITLKTQELTLKQEKLENYKRKAAEEAKKESRSAASSKAFYKPAAQGLDTEAVIAGEFNEILELIRANQIKIRSMKSEYEPNNDEFVKGAPAEYNVARLNLEMISNYISFNNFMKELYKHEHFLDLESIEIVPYKKDKTILLINFKIKLYAKK